MKIHVTREWSESRLPAEDGHEIGAGCPAVAGSPCSALGYMDRLSYGGFFEEAEKRHAAADRQTYCANCKLAQWPEEQRTCPNFVRSEELEAFYAEENSQPTGR